MNESTNNQVKRLQDSVILIINGLSESGRVLAEMLAQQGADVAIVDSRQNPQLADSISRDVKTHGRRCLVLTSSPPAAQKMSFPQFVIKKIIENLGRLDAFISYSGSDVIKPTVAAAHHNGRYQNPIFFDQEGLAMAALRHIFAQKQD